MFLPQFCVTMVHIQADCPMKLVLLMLASLVVNVSVSCV